MSEKRIEELLGNVRNAYEEGRLWCLSNGHKPGADRFESRVAAVDVCLKLLKDEFAKV